MGTGHGVLDVGEDAGQLFGQGSRLAVGERRARRDLRSPCDLDLQIALGRVGERVVELTAREFDLLLHFARHPGRVYSRGQLLDHVWGYSHSGYEHTVNSHINRLRKKLEIDPQQAQYIETVWGVGYRFAGRPVGP